MGPQNSKDVSFLAEATVMLKSMKSTSMFYISCIHFRCLYVFTILLKTFHSLNTSCYVKFMKIRYEILEIQSINTFYTKNLSYIEHFCNCFQIYDFYLQLKILLNAKLAVKIILYTRIGSTLNKVIKYSSVVFQKFNVLCLNHNT